MASNSGPAYDTCPQTGLGRPECSCPTCIQALLDQFAPRDARVTAGRQGIFRPLPDRLPTSGGSDLSVAERLSLPAL